MDHVNQLHEEAMRHAGAAVRARIEKREDEARDLYTKAFELERNAADLTAAGIEPERSVLYRSAITLAIHAGRLADAIELLDRVIEDNPLAPIAEELRDAAEQHPYPDAWLINAFCAHDPHRHAVQALLLRHSRRLYRVCYGLTWDEDRAKDLMQETFLRMWRNRNSLDPQGDLTAWLATVARNIHIDQFRRSQREGEMARGKMLSLNQPISVDVEDSDELEGLIEYPDNPDPERANLLKAAIDRVMRTFTEDERRLLSEYYGEGRTFEEMGKDRECSGQAVGPKVRRAAKAFRERFDTEWPRP
jgi:RNA polymerase sigma-70 factor, ECF subfamily